MGRRVGLLRRFRSAAALAATIGCRDRPTVVAVPQAPPAPLVAASPAQASISPPAAITPGLSPRVQMVSPGGEVDLRISIAGTAVTPRADALRLTVDEPGGGTVDATGRYTAPQLPGTYHVTATSVVDRSRSARAELVVGLVDPARMTQWDPGVRGGIPVRNTVCATVSAGDFGGGAVDATAAVQKAIDGCLEGQVVQLTEGTFHWGSTVRLDKGVTLRGAGHGRTVVNGANTRYLLVGPTGPPSNDVYRSLVAHTRLVSDAKKGGSTLVVSDGSEYHAGDLALVSMKDDATIMPPPGPGGDYLLWIDPDGTRHSNGQMVTVAAVSGNTLKIEGVLHSDYTLANAAIVGRAPAVVRRAGIEGIRFVRPESAFIITFCDECWVSGSETDTSGGDSALWLSRRGEVRDTYVHDAQTLSPGGAGYGLTLVAYTSDSLVEDNVIYFFNKPFLFRASGGGNVVAYNYIDGAQDGAAPWWMEPDIDSHTVYSHMELVEGNLCGAIGFINTWGGAGALTIFRNRVLGQHQDPRLINAQFGNQAAITMNAGMGAYSNILGNVLGLPGLTSAGGANKGKAAIYENVSEHDPDDLPRTALGYAGSQLIAMYRLGNGSVAGSYASFDVDEPGFPQVPRVAPTVLRHGNFDYVTGSVVADARVPAIELPASMYLMDRPSFFGDRVWPWVEARKSPMVRSLPAKERFDRIRR